MKVMSNALELSTNLQTMPPWLDVFGWCTWDAFYSSVCAKDLPAGLGTLRAGGKEQKIKKKNKTKKKK